MVKGHLHELDDIVGGLAGNKGTHVHVGVEGVAYLDGFGRLNHALHDSFVQIRNDGHYGAGQAALSG